MELLLQANHSQHNSGVQKPLFFICSGSVTVVPREIENSTYAKFLGGGK